MMRRNFLATIFAAMTASGAFSGGYTDTAPVNPQPEGIEPPTVIVEKAPEAGGGLYDQAGDVLAALDRDEGPAISTTPSDDAKTPAVETAGPDANSSPAGADRAEDHVESEKPAEADKTEGNTQPPKAAEADKAEGSAQPPKAAEADKTEGSAQPPKAAGADKTEGNTQPESPAAPGKAGDPAPVEAPAEPDGGTSETPVTGNAPSTEAEAEAWAIEQRMIIANARQNLRKRQSAAANNARPNEDLVTKAELSEDANTGTPEQKEIVDEFLEEHPTFSRWDRDDTYFGFAGCTSFARILQDKVYGVYGSGSPGKVDTIRDPYKVQQYDVVSINGGSHDVFVLRVIPEENLIEVAQGNVDGKVYNYGTVSVDNICTIYQHAVQ